MRTFLCYPGMKKSITATSPWLGDFSSPLSVEENMPMFKHSNVSIQNIPEPLEKAWHILRIQQTIPSTKTGSKLIRKDAEVPPSRAHFPKPLVKNGLGVSKNRGTPKMDGENNGKPYEQMDDLGVPLFSETPTFKSLV